MPATPHRPAEVAEIDFHPAWLPEGAFRAVGSRRVALSAPADGGTPAAAEVLATLRTELDRANRRPRRCRRRALRPT
ncbi:hypothetical protein UQW22_02065 [Isoptericola halotolerans]|uniref:hypothetical protein n=1 Tax=Isoptericola halotolerans TaxID=300560 RepID=UPI00388EEC58